MAYVARKEKLQVIKTIAKALNNKKGLTLVNVMVGFVVMAVGIVVFQQTVNLAINTYTKAENMRNNTENLFSQFYRQTRYSLLENEVTQFDHEQGMASNTFVFKSEDDSGDFTITTNRSAFEYEQHKVYFFGNRQLN